MLPEKTKEKDNSRIKIIKISNYIFYFISFYNLLPNPKSFDHRQRTFYHIV